jgi:trans-2,3-dihydro-3-hydroxyanthranilate isomerase
MHSKRFIIADVFTEERFGGNQLAVFVDGDGLDPDTMQKIAREMNYAETTFLFAPRHGGDYYVRIFTPARELPFAGHPLVGTGYVIVAERLKPWSEPLTAVTLETGVGPIPLEVSIEQGKAAFTAMTQPVPILRGTCSDVVQLAGALSIEPAAIETTGLPIETMYNGVTVMIVPVATRQAIENIQIDAGLLKAISYANGADTVLTFTRETLRPTSTVHCRVFAPAVGISEDPATGSANGPLGCYLVKHRLVEVRAVTSIISEQGFAMQRPSLLHIEMEVDVATHAVGAVRVGGGVIIAGRGDLLLS